MIEECCCIVYEGPDRDEDDELLHDVWQAQATSWQECCECGASIRPGELYEHVDGVWDGVSHTYHTCLTCAQIRKDLFRCGFNYTCLRDELWECYELDL